LFLLEEAVIDAQENLALKEGQEPDLQKIEPSCQKSFDEGKFIRTLMHKLPILSTITYAGIMGMVS
jgi:hypothetical protein